MAGWAAVCAVHFALTRTAAFLWARPKAAAGAFRQRVAVVGWGEDADTAVRLLDGADPLRIEVIGLFDDRGSRAGSAAMGDLVEAAGAGKVDLIVVAIPFTLEDRLLQTLKQLWPLPVDIRIARQASQLKLSPRAYGYLGNLPLLSVFDRPLGRRRRAKHVLDRALAALLLVILLPVLVPAPWRCGSKPAGPVLVREPRHGFDGAPLAVSFRLRARAAGRRGLRRLRLDGAPMLLNVLKGEMSLVGPRLHGADAGPAGLYRQVIDGYFARHEISRASPAGRRSTT
jgi:lipopolysaccharide/colanic/teichoic acid biosynthesis glycosyltransferase